MTELGYCVIGAVFATLVCRGMISDARRMRDFWYEMYRKRDEALNRLAQREDGPYR